MCTNHEPPHSSGCLCLEKNVTYEHSRYNMCFQPQSQDSSSCYLQGTYCVLSSTVTKQFFIISIVINQLLKFHHWFTYNIFEFEWDWLVLHDAGETAHPHWKAPIIHMPWYVPYKNKSLISRKHKIEVQTRLQYSSRESSGVWMDR